MLTNPYLVPFSGGVRVAPRIHETLVARRTIFTCSVQFRELAFHKWSDLLVQLSGEEFRAYLVALETLGFTHSR